MSCVRVVDDNLPLGFNVRPHSASLEIPKCDSSYAFCVQGWLWFVYVAYLDLSINFLSICTPIKEIYMSDIVKIAIQLQSVL